MNAELTSSASCVVTPEWVRSVSSCISRMQGYSCAQELRQETDLLARLMYKNSNQHRATRPFRKLQEVLRLLRLMEEADLNAEVQYMTDALAVAAKPTLTLHERTVPILHSAVVLLRRAQASCHLTEALSTATISAAAQFTTQLAQSFFMPLSLTCLAIIARIRVLNAQMLLDSIQIYNAIIEAAEMLPDPDNAASTAFRSLPKLLTCSWTHGQPRLVAVPWSASLDPDKPSAATILGLRILGEPPKDIGCGGTTAGGLAVIEDRGIAISRAQFRTEVRQAVVAEISSVDAKTAVANVFPIPIGPTSQAPLYKRAVAGPAALGGYSHAARRVAGNVDVVDAPNVDLSLSMETEKSVLQAAFPKPFMAKSSLPSLPNRSTAFISVDDLNSRKKDGKPGAGKSIIVPGAGAVRAQATNSATAKEEPQKVSNTGSKPWEEWLSPLTSQSNTSSAALRGLGGGSSGHKKKRRR